MTGDILRTALEFANQGICAVPVATDGSKRPALALEAISRAQADP
jgi:hypothetical protein